MRWIRSSPRSLVCVVVVVVLLGVAVFVGLWVAAVGQATAADAGSVGRAAVGDATAAGAGFVGRATVGDATAAGAGFVGRAMAVSPVRLLPASVRGRPRPDHPVPVVALRRAVAATLAARSATVVGRVSSARSPDVTAEVRGTTSFVEPLATFTVTTTAAPSSSEVRIRGHTAWVRAGGDDHWTTMAAGAAGYVLGRPSWPDLFRSLVARPDTIRWLDPAHRHLAALVDGRASTITLDPAGRIRSLRLGKGAGITLALDLSNLGTKVVVVPP